MPTYPTMQTTADAAQIIENKINQETDKLRSRLAVHCFRAPGVDVKLDTECADLRQRIKLMKDGGAMIAAAFTNILAAE